MDANIFCLEIGSTFLSYKSFFFSIEILRKLIIDFEVRPASGSKIPHSLHVGLWENYSASFCPVALSLKLGQLGFAHRVVFTVSANVGK